MADVKTLKELINSLKDEDFKNLRGALEQIKGETDNAKDSAIAYVENLKKGQSAIDALNAAIAEGYGNLAKTEGEANTQAQVRLQVLNAIQDTLNKTNQLGEKDAKLIEDLKKQNEELLKTKKEQLATDTKSADIGTKNLDISKKLTATVKENQIKAAGLFSLGSLGGNLTKGLDKASSMAASAGNKLSGLWEATKNFGSGLMGTVAPALAAGASRLGAFGDILPQIMDSVKTLYLEFSTLTTGFVKFTGQVIKGDAAVSNFTGRVMALQRRNRMFGTTVKEVTESMTNLTKASRTYGMLQGTNAKRNIAVVDGLTEMSIRFSKVGLGAESFGKALDVLGNTYRRSDIIKQGKLLGAEFVNIARVTGQSADMVGKNFADAMKNLAQYSLPQAKEEFRKLSIISASAGVEMGTVMKVAGQFNDIEKSAEAVGELNAMMGGPYLNTLDLVNATEAERIEMLKDMMTQSGESFATMDRFKKQAIAQSIGVDVQEAARLFGAQQKDIDSATSAVDKNGASYKQLGLAAAKSAVSMSDQMEATKQSMLLSKEAYSEVHKIFKMVNLQASKLGDTMRKDIGGVLVGTLRKAKAELLGLIGAFANWDRSGTDKVHLLAKLGRVMGTLGLVGKEGMAAGMMTSAAIEHFDNPATDAAPQAGGEKTLGDFMPVPIAPKSAQDTIQKTNAVATAPEPNLSPDTEKARENMKSMIDYLAPMLGEKITEAMKKGMEGVALNVDGDELARTVTGGRQQ